MHLESSETWVQVAGWRGGGLILPAEERYVLGPREGCSSNRSRR